MESQDPVRRISLDIKALTIFCGITFASAWLLDLPLWISRNGLTDPIAPITLAITMLCPSIGVVGVLLIRPQSIKPVAIVTGLAASGAKQTLFYSLVAWFIVVLLVFLALFVGATFGLYHFDLKNFSGLAEILQKGQRGAALLTQVPIGYLVAVELLLPPIAPLLNAPFVFGEEWGWQGFLLPKLLPLGQWPALILCGAIWGFWHAPIVFLGFDYPQHRELGVILMVAFCVIIGILIGWLRLASGSIWPCVVAHGTLNGSVGIAYILADAKSSFDTAQATILGWTGWILPLLLIALLILTRRLPVKLPAPGTSVS
jgi:uncharacterized protein